MKKYSNSCENDGLSACRILADLQYSYLFHYLCLS